MTSLAVEPEYLAARKALLDALDVLAQHRHSLVVVGAQAVYARTVAAGLTVAPFTTDGDLAVDPRTLGDEPNISGLMLASGFTLKTGHGGGIQPGQWERTVEVDDRLFTVQVDLIVPADVLPGTRSQRGARLPAHGKTAAMRTHGLEAALVDNDPVLFTALDERDKRQTLVKVAGVAALLVAKLHKINDRVAAGGRPDRLVDKDAGDVLRLIRSTPVVAIADVLAYLRDDELSARATSEAIGTLPSLLATPTSPAVQMAVRAVAFDLDRELVETQLTAYARELIDRLNQPRS